MATTNPLPIHEPTVDSLLSEDNSSLRPDEIKKAPNSTKKSTKRLPKPSWIKIRPASGNRYLELKELFRTLNLATVCQEAQCPNIGECWSGGTATIMLMGEVCTRGCRFCNVKTGNPKGKLDLEEPQKVAHAISKMDLDYVVLTSVDRDDLPDEGSGHFASTVKLLKQLSPNLIIEVLTPDFKGQPLFINKIVDAKPDVFAHNVETVERLSARVRDPRASYQQSLSVLAHVKKYDSSRYTKTSLMLGLGETEEEVRQTLRDLRGVDCDVVTFGQYLQPQKRHLPVEEFITPERFAQWQTEAENMGFLYVASGPLVRSSYRAGEFFMRGMIEKNKGKEIL
ncbi:MAG: lipoyl synthase [Bdellovibrionales bacterium]|nr:lipoyl synthase [Bdellovibrionales bacterium]